MASIPLLRTKLHIPVPSANLVHRPQLLTRLNDGLRLGHRLTLVSAPVGFGKTNLFNQWATSQEIQKRVAWLTLEDEDDSPTRFWAYVVAAIQSALEGVGELSSAYLRSAATPSIEVILTPLLNELADQTERVMLVVDNYHLISRDEIHTGVTFLIEHQPEQLHLAICTRADPPLPIARIRARGQLTELRGDDLRFTRDEVRSYLNDQLKLGLTETEITDLDARIEGWIAGLEQAAISIRDQVDRHGFITAFTSSHSFILEYLVEQVLNSLPEGILHFLDQTSILSQLCASLCDQVSDRRDSETILARLYHDNLFVSVLDDEHTWYRYHALFADLLRNRLQGQLDRQVIADLHLRASRWYEENGYLRIAVRHAEKAGDLERVAHLAEEIAQASLLDSWMTDMLAWLETLPAHVLRSRLRLRIYQACALFFDGQSDACVQILEETRQVIEMLPTSAENNALQQELHRLIEITYMFIDTLTLSMQGSLYQSEQVMLNAKQLAEEAGNVFLLAHAYEGLALNQYHQGQLRAAASSCWQLIELAGGSRQERRPAQPLPIATAGYLLLANICLDKNKLQKMEQHLGKAFALCRQSGGAKSLAETYIMQSRLQQAQGELESAYEAIHIAEQAYPLKTSLVTAFRLESQKAKLNLEAGALEDVIHWVRGMKMAAEQAKPTVQVPALLQEVAQLILARAHLAKGEPEDGLAVLEGIQMAAETDGHLKHVIEIHTLKALAFRAFQQDQLGLNSLEKALRLAEKEGFVRVFLDTAYLDSDRPMQQLLYKAFEHGITPEFTREILVSFPPILEERQKSVMDHQQALSRREIEVLEQLAKGITNREVALQLGISLDTVKTHTSNIYGKLGVHSRAHAVVKARVLGLINQNT